MTDDPCDPVKIIRPLTLVDPFDPNNWQPMSTDRRVYLDAHCETYAIVDEVDYLWAVQWLWHLTPNSTGKKFYATRMTRSGTVTGPQTKIYMHKEILLRSGKPQPSPKHTIGDHEDGDSLNCRRSNLWWVTRSMNRRNIYGIAALQRAMSV